MCCAMVSPTTDAKGVLWVISHADRPLPAPALLKTDDVLLLRSDAVLLLQQPWQYPIPCYVIKEDCELRNLPIPASVKGIGYDGWVTLSLNKEKVVNW